MNKIYEYGGSGLVKTIMVEAESKGWKLQRVRPFDDNPANDYLKFTLVKIGDKYATHLYNVQDNAFYEGHYDIENYGDALDDLFARR
jgi:hypothetical protein